MTQFVKQYISAPECSFAAFLPQCGLSESVVFQRLRRRHSLDSCCTCSRLGAGRCRTDQRAEISPQQSTADNRDFYFSVGQVANRDRTRRSTLIGYAGCRRLRTLHTRRRSESSPAESDALGLAADAVLARDAFAIRHAQHPPHETLFRRAPPLLCSGLHSIG